MKITAIPFVTGAFMPEFFGWWESYEFAIIITLVMLVLVLTKQVKLL